MKHTYTKLLLDSVTTRAMGSLMAFGRSRGIRIHELAIQKWISAHVDPDFDFLVRGVAFHSEGWSPVKIEFNASEEGPKAAMVRIGFNPEDTL